jgi:hypothetical protein
MRRIGLGVVITVSAWFLASSCSAYTVADLPPGWGIDANEVDGTLLPAYGADANGVKPDGSDPKTWLMEVGAFERIGKTNGWVAGLRFISSEPPVSSGLFVFSDPNTGFSTTWTLDGWVRPGPNYKVIEAWSWPMWNLIIPRTRYTIVVVGVTPAGTEAVLE